MKFFLLIIVLNIFLVHSTKSQIQYIDFKNKPSHTKYTLSAEIYNNTGELLYSEKSVEYSDREGSVKIKFNWGKVELTDLQRTKSFCVILKDSSRKIIDRKYEEVDSYVNQAIINKIESKRILRIENELINQDLLDNISFWYDGKIVTYGIVKYKGRYWMDRNLGAERVATSLKDTLAYGDLFQWGREVDGHQLRDNTFFTNQVAIGGKQPNHNEYIIPAEGIDWNFEGSKNCVWYNGLNKVMKTAVNVCPDGWHVPTANEWRLTLGNWRTKQDAFNSVLKFPASDRRPVRDELKKGKYLISFMTSFYWSSSREDNTGYINVVNFSNDWVKIMTNFPSDAGLPVRCIKDN